MIAILETGGGSSSETGWCAHTYLEITEFGEDSYRVVCEYRFGWIRWLSCRGDYAEIVVEPQIWKWIFQNALVPTKYVKIHHQRKAQPKIPRRFFKPHEFDPVEDR